MKNSVILKSSIKVQDILCLKNKVFSISFAVDFFELRKISINLLYSLSLKTFDKETVSVLCYHSISSSVDRYSIDYDQFEKQIKRMVGSSNFVSADEVVEILDGKEVKGPAVLLTIDDGYADVLNLLPLFKKYRIPVTLFILAEPENADRTELGNENQLLNWQQIKFLVENGVTIGCHSATHADFSNLTKDQIKREVILAKQKIESRLGIEVKYFAYPKGRYNLRIISAVKKAGYKAAFAVLSGSVIEQNNRFELPRTVIDKTHQVEEFPAVYSQTTFMLRKATDRFKIWERFLNGN